MTIELRNLTKQFRFGQQTKHVARNVTMTLPAGGSIGVLGRNGAGKSTLLSMVSGRSSPDSGDIVIHGSVSWPVGFSGSFHPLLSGSQNVRFLARVYGVDTGEMEYYVRHFAELGSHYYQPVRTYSSGMRSRLAFGCSMAIKFDWYLVDEVTSVGDAAFKEKSEAVFRDRMRSSSALYVSHAVGSLRRVCDAAIVLEDGYFTYYDDVREGIAAHQENLNSTAGEDE